ncbi:MAG: PDZ domain-containing protein [Actinomycetia bacterium]|nr:PDZ domain-containing protein [Actinomycetes bacterium]MCP4228005.1 PDZ domain-containing protein [Actinomycetes bacterium]MCP5032319.1 PDZ domain-containing protein [Actinomycetes bacterium]
MIAAVVVGGMMLEVPYVALVPGSARDTEPLLVVEGLEAYPSDGELLLTTVRVRQRPNLWEYLWLKVDDDAEIVSEDVILSGRTPDENREFNLQLMNDSKSIAIAVALEELGYDSIKSDGVVIAELVEGEAAESVLELGDTVVAIDGEPVVTTSDLIDLLAQAEPGDEITLTVESFVPGVEVEPHEVSVVLGSKPDDPDTAFLGVGPTDRVDINRDFDFMIDIDTGAVGGPSAGLAFTLAVLDQLTPGELTGGATVAVTGTIDVGGRVGTVGGVVQKTAAVRDLGADVFLVPAGLPQAELDRITDRAGDDLEVIPVEDLDDALAALAGLGGEVDAVEEFAASNPS